jgi:predicted ArsR family transcriptional regulator
MHDEPVNPHSDPAVRLQRPTLLALLDAPAGAALARGAIAEHLGVSPDALAPALDALAARGLAVADGEQVRASDAARALDELGLLAI